MGDHKRSKRFRNDSFDITLLEESDDRSYIESRETYWINHLDTYHNGLNESPSGKGWGHNSPNFTTLGYVYSDEARAKMSAAAKARAAREGFNVRSEASKKGWANGGEEYREHQKNVRKGKRLSPPKLTDEEVSNIRLMWSQEKQQLERECEKWNEEAKRKGWKLRTPEGLFYIKHKDDYNVSKPTIVNIVKNKCRTEILPSICKS